MPKAEASPLQHSFEAIGTAWSIESTRELVPSLLEDIASLVSRFDATWSRFRDDSLISTIAKNSGSYLFPPEATPLFGFYRQLYELSGGLITPLVGRTLEALGYDRSYTLSPHPGAPPAIPSWDDAFSFDAGTLHAPKPVLIDVGAAGKGLLVDLVTALLLHAGHMDCVVDASGDLRRVCSTDSSERVALENPANPARALGIAHLHTGSLAASGTNRRRWSPSLHHVLDGLTGLPSAGVLASWVIADSAMVADGIATALLLTDPEPFAEAFLIEWVTLSDTGVLRVSDNFSGEVFQ